MNKGRLGIWSVRPGAGINGVIAATTIEGINRVTKSSASRWLQVAGTGRHAAFQRCPSRREGHSSARRPILAPRAQPDQVAEQMNNIFSVFEKLGITALVTIAATTRRFRSVVAKQALEKSASRTCPRRLTMICPAGSTPTFGLKRHGTRVHLSAISRGRAHHVALVSSSSAWPRGAPRLASPGRGHTIIPEEFTDDRSLDEVCDIISAPLSSGGRRFAIRHCHPCRRPHRGDGRKRWWRRCRKADRTFWQGGLRRARPFALGKSNSAA